MGGPSAGIAWSGTAPVVDGTTVASGPLAGPSTYLGPTTGSAGGAAGPAGPAIGTGVAGAPGTPGPEGTVIAVLAL